MRREAAILVGVLMAIAALLNVTITPEDKEAIEYLINAFILFGGVGIIRQFVASRWSVEKVDRKVARKVFDNE